MVSFTNGLVLLVSCCMLVSIGADAGFLDKMFKASPEKPQEEEPKLDLEGLINKGGKLTFYEDKVKAYDYASEFINKFYLKRPQITDPDARVEAIVPWYKQEGRKSAGSEIHNGLALLIKLKVDIDNKRCTDDAFEDLRFARKTSGHSRLWRGLNWNPLKEVPTDQIIYQYAMRHSENCHEKYANRLIEDIKEKEESSKMKKVSEIFTEKLIDEFRQAEPDDDEFFFAPRETTLGCSFQQSPETFSILVKPLQREGEDEKATEKRLKEDLYDSCDAFLKDLSGTLKPFYFTAELLGRDKKMKPITEFPPQVQYTLYRQRFCESLPDLPYLVQSVRKMKFN